MLADEYLAQAVKNVETELAKIRKKLSTRASTPMAQGYKPKLGVSPVLDAGCANYYQNLVGVLWWAVELDRIDIYLEVSLLSAYNAQPRQGHLEQVFYIFAYLKAQNHSTIMFDDSLPNINDSQFPNYNWKDIYGDV